MKPFIVGTSISAASQILCLKKRELSTDLYLIKDFKLERESYAAYLISYAVGNMEFSLSSSLLVHMSPAALLSDSLQSVMKEHWSSLPAS